MLLPEIAMSEEEIVEKPADDEEFDEEELFSGMRKLSEFSSVLSHAMGQL